MAGLSYSQNVSKADFKEKQVIWAKDKDEALQILETAIADESDSISVQGLWRTSSDIPEIPENNVDGISFSDTQSNPDLEQSVFADWIKGEKIDWKSYYKGCGIRKVNVPNYQFREKVFGLKTT